MSECVPLPRRQLHAYELFTRGRNSITEKDLPGAIFFEADAIAAILKRFHDSVKAEQKEPSLGAADGEQKSDGGAAASSAKHMPLTGGQYCGSPRKSKQPHTPRLAGKRGHEEINGATIPPLAKRLPASQTA